MCCCIFFLVTISQTITLDALITPTHNNSRAFLRILTTYPVDMSATVLYKFSSALEMRCKCTIAKLCAEVKENLLQVNQHAVKQIISSQDSWQRSTFETQYLLLEVNNLK